MKKNDGGPAFPKQAVKIQRDGKEYSEYVDGASGMSLRDWFAGMALNHPYAQSDDTYMHGGKAAAWAYELADAMLQERDKEE